MPYMRSSTNQMLAVLCQSTFLGQDVKRGAIGASMWVRVWVWVCAYACDCACVEQTRFTFIECACIKRTSFHIDTIDPKFASTAVFIFIRFG